MFTLKVSFHGKNIMMGKSTDSLTKIQNELKTRFPGQFPHGVVLKYQGNVITDYQQIEDILFKSINKTLKIEAQIAPPIQSEALEEENPSGVENISLQKEEEETQQKNEEIQEPIAKPEVKEEQNYQPELKVEKEDEIQQKEIVIDQVIKQSDAINEFHKPTNVEPYKQVDVYKEDLEESKDNKQEPIKQNPNKKYISNISSCVSSEPFGEYVEEPPQNQLYEIEPGVYRCIFCKDYQNCNVCDSKKKIYQNSKFVKLVNKIVDRRLEQKMEEMENRILDRILFDKLSKINKDIALSQKSYESKEKVSQEKKVSKSSILSNSFEIKEVTNKKQINVGEQFTRTFQIKPRKQLQVPYELAIVDERTGQTKNIVLDNVTQVTVGPFSIEKQGIFDKTYRLCIIDQDSSLRIFGPKFGFSVLIMKPKQIKMLSNGFRKVVEDIKKGYKIDRSTEFLIEKLKELGITEDNYQQNKSLLSDIIQTV